MAADSLLQSSRDLPAFDSQQSKWGYNTSLQLSLNQKSSQIKHPHFGSIRALLFDESVAISQKPIDNNTSVNFNAFKCSPRRQSTSQCVNQGDYHKQIKMLQDVGISQNIQLKQKDSEVKKLTERYGSNPKSRFTSVMKQENSNRKEMSVSENSFYNTKLTEISQYQSMNQSQMNSNRFRMFKSKDRKSVQQRLIEKIESNSVPKNNTSLANLSAMKKCQILQESDSKSNRHQLLRCITRKPRSIQQCQKTAEISPNRNEVADAVEAYSQAGSRYRIIKKRSQITLSGRESILSEIQQFEEMISDKDVFKKLKINTQKRDEEPPLINDLKVYHKDQSVERQSTQIVLQPKQYQQTKYLDLGEIGEYYAKKEYEASQLAETQKEMCYQASKTNIFQPWTGERIAAKYCQSRQDQVCFLMHRVKKEHHDSPQKKMKKQFAINLEQYVQDLSSSRNLSFLKQSPKVASQVSQETALRVPSVHTPSSKRYTEQRMESLSARKFNAQDKVNPPKSNLITTSNIKIANLDDQIIRQEQPYEMHKLIDKLIGKLQFQELCKQSGGTISDAMKNDPRQQYFKECRQALEPALDILGKIQNKTLVLEEYTLGEGQCTGVMDACLQNKTLLNKVSIDNCFMSQKGLARLFKGLAAQKQLTSLRIKRLQLEKEDCEQISQILQRNQVRFCIDDFRIEKCTVSNDDFNIILQGLLQGGSVKTLAIVEQTLQQAHIAILSEFIKSARFLSNLDLSWTRISTQNSFLPLLKTICSSKKLVYINISWIKLLKNTNFSAHGLETDVTEHFEQQFMEASQGDGFGLTTKTSKKNQELTHDQEVMEALIELISKNQKLIHLDLSETGLTQEIIFKLIKAIRISTSLIGIHLSGNPGITPKIEKQIMSKLNATFEKALNLDPFQKFAKTDLRLQIPQEKQKLRISESIFLKELHQTKRFESNDTSQAENAQMRHFILTRKIGHQLEIPGSSEWHIYKENSKQCYICDRKIYSIFFWSPQIGMIEGYDIGLSPQEQFLIAKQILNNRETNIQRKQALMTLDSRVSKSWKKQVYNDELGDFEDEVESAEHELLSDCENLEDRFVQKGPSIEIKRQNNKKFETPLLYGQFNNWQPQPMIHVTRIAEAMDKFDSKQLISEMRQQGQCRDEVKEIKHLQKWEREYYQAKLSEYRQKYFQDQVWTEALMRLIAYKEPHFTSASLIHHIQTSQLYVAMNFIGCGRQDYMVQHGSQFYFHQTIADFRREEIKFTNLSFAQKKQKERNPDVFKNWQVDDQKMIENCCKFDFEYWKVQNFVKEPAEIEALKNVIKQNYIILKEIYILIAGRSCFPCISSLETGLFIQECGFIDKNMTQGIIDTQFIASRVDVEKRNFKVHGQNVLDANRFEFLECMVRIANCKFKQTGLAQTVAQAFQLFIDQITTNYTIYTSQQFRNELLWTREVNLTLDANKTELRAVYDFCIKTKSKKVTQGEIMKLLTTQTNIKLSENDARMCYAQSLQSIPDIVKNSFVKACHIDFIEFLEMVGRVAHCTYSDEPQTKLHEKINRVIDEWLGLVGLQRQEPEYYEQSDSD